MRKLIVVAAVTLGATLLATGGSSQPVDGFNPQVTVDATTTLKTGGATLDWHGRATIKRRADDALVMVYRTGSRHNSADADLHIRFSDDNGATWTADDTTLGGAAVAGFPMGPPIGDISYGDGWLMIAPNGDLILHMWSVTGTSPTGTLNGTYQSRSSDGGHIWSDPVAVSFAGNPSPNTDTFATDDNFVWDGVIYAGARIYYDLDGDPSASILVKSEDDGNTWEYVSEIMGQTEGGTGGQEFGMEYVGQDTIVAMIRDNAHTNSYRRISTDLGANWGTLDNVTSLVGIAARQRVYTRMHLQGESGWWKDPVLIMVGFVHQTSGQSMPRRNAVWVSPDRGQTWDGPHYIAAQTDDAGYGDIFWNGTGYTVVSYTGTLEAADLKQYDLSVELR